MKGKIENKNTNTNYSLECIFCGENKGLNLVAHRHFISNNIRGFVVVCQDCLKNKLQNNDWYFKVDCVFEKEANND